MSVQAGSGMSRAGQIPSPGNPAEEDSLRQVYGQALVGLGNEILNPEPNPLLMQKLQGIIQQATDAMARGRAEFQGSKQTQGSTLQTGVPQPARKPADSLTRQSL